MAVPMIIGADGSYSSSGPWIFIDADGNRVSVNRSAYNVSSYGAKCDGRALRDANVSSGTNILTSATANFTQADVGKTISCQPISSTGSPRAFSGRTITAVNSSTSITFSGAASAVTVTTGEAVFGTDDYAAVLAAIAAAAVDGGTVFFPAGICFISSLAKILVPGGVQLRGASKAIWNPRTAQYIGTVLYNGKFLSAQSFIELGIAGSSLPRAAELHNMSIDGSNNADYAVRIAGVASRIDGCSIGRGIYAAMSSEGGSTWITNNAIFNQATGHGLFISAGDQLVRGNYIYGSGIGHTVYIKDCADVNVTHNHLYKAGWSDALSAAFLGSNIYIDATFNSFQNMIACTNNVLDSVWGPQITIAVAGASTLLRGVKVDGNMIFNNNASSAATYPVFSVSVGSGAALAAYSIQGNVCIGAWETDTGFDYTALIDWTSSAGTIYGGVVRGNVAKNCEAISINGHRAEIQDANVVVPNGLTYAVTDGEFTTEVTVTTGELLALNATPKTLIAAPGAGRALIFLGAQIWYDYNSAAYAGIAGTEELAIRYTGTAGAIVGTCEPTGFLDQTADEQRWVYPLSPNTAPDTSIEPPANAPLVLHMTVGEITTGNSPLKIRIRARMITTSW